MDVLYFTLHPVLTFTVWLEVSWSKTRYKILVCNFSQLDRVCDTLGCVIRLTTKHIGVYFIV